MVSSLCLTPIKLLISAGKPVNLVSSIAPACKIPVSPLVLFRRRMGESQARVEAQGNGLPTVFNIAEPLYSQSYILVFAS